MSASDLLKPRAFWVGAAARSAGSGRFGVQGLLQDSEEELGEAGGAGVRLGEPDGGRERNEVFVVGGGGDRG